MNYQQAQAIREMAKSILNPVNQSPELAKSTVNEALEMLDEFYPELGADLSAPMDLPMQSAPAPQQPAPAPSAQDNDQLLQELMR